MIRKQNTNRLKYFFQNIIVTFVNDTRILTSLSTDHSPVHLSMFQRAQTHKRQWILEIQ